MLKLAKDESSILSTSIKTRQLSGLFLLEEVERESNTLALDNCKLARGPKAIACRTRARDFCSEGSLELDTNLQSSRKAKRGFWWKRSVQNLGMNGMIIVI